MSAKKSYNRFFIIFQEEDRGYGISPDRPPTGYAKVETKNEKSKVTVYAQNLKPFESGECLYKCYLISHQDEKDSTIYLGMMNIDDLGRGESSFESGSENAFDSKTSIDKFNGAAIVVDREGIDKVIAPLAGYMSKEKFNWRNIIPVAKKLPKEGTVQAETDIEVQNIVPTEEAKKFKEYEEAIQKFVEKDEDTESDVLQKEEDVVPEVLKNQWVDERKDVELEAREREETLKISLESKAEASENGYNKQVLESPVEEFDDEIRGGHKEDKYYNSSCAGHCGQSYRHVMKKMLEDILEDYEKVDRHKDLKDCSIWKVDMEKCRKDGHKIGMYPCYDLIFHPMMYNPGFNHSTYIMKHGHYLFGMKHDKDRKVLAILFGIPGKNILLDQPFGGKTGFAKWVKWGDGDKGYWIMMYDPMTGIILSQK